MKVWIKVELALILILISVGIYVFASPYLMKRSGVVVVSVSNKDCQNVQAGDIITEAGGNQIKGNEDFTSIRFQPNQFVSLVVNAGPGGCVALSDGTIGIDTKEISSQGIVFGVDLVGGREYMINTTSIPTNQLQNISHTLKIRSSYLGLADMKILNENNMLKIIAGKNTNVNQLLFQGLFEASIEQMVALKNNIGNFAIGTDNHTVTQIGANYLIDNETRSVSDIFYLKDVKTVIVNKTNTSIIISLTAFNNSDILGEVIGYSQSSFDKNSEMYTFTTPIRLSTDAGKRFAEITQNIKTIVAGTQVSLDSALVYKLDGVELSRLGMPVTLKGQELSTLYVIVNNKNQENMLNKKNAVQATINAGYINYALSVANTSEVLASQKNNVIPSLGLIVFAIGIVPLFFAVRYKKMKGAVLAVLIGFAEIFSVLALFTAFQIFYKLNFVLDFPALSGIVLLSLNWMVNIISLNLSKHAQKDLIIKIKYKKIISATGLVKISCITISLIFAAYGYSSAIVVVLLGVVLDYLIFRPLYRETSSR
jgi:hypothetical protein